VAETTAQVSDTVAEKNDPVPASIAEPRIGTARPPVEADMRATVALDQALEKVEQTAADKEAAELAATEAATTDLASDEQFEVEPPASEKDANKPGSV
jgi:hypothetical protein